MIGYKGFDKNLKCRGFQYEIWQTYTLDGDLEICNNGFHFCETISDVYNYYPKDGNTRICKVEALGKIVSGEGGKHCTDKIKILEEITNNSIKKCNVNATSTGYCNTGNYNSGDYNTGNNNSGKYNTGDYNDGNYNVGNYNSGDSNNGSHNSGDDNVGSHNSGDGNVGSYNSGNRNTDYFNFGDYNNGSYNSGDHNNGNSNSGNFNIGNYNTGNGNIGSFNTGDHNNGFFNTTDATIRLFNKDSNMTISEFYKTKAYEIIMYIIRYAEYSEWVQEHRMTKEEKEKHPDYKVTRGYMKYVGRTNRTQQIIWDNLSEEDKNEVMSLPNFDKDIFKQCTGIDVERRENLKKPMQK